MGDQSFSSIAIIFEIKMICEGIEHDFFMSIFLVMTVIPRSLYMLFYFYRFSIYDFISRCLPQKIQSHG